MAATIVSSMLMTQGFKLILDIVEEALMKGDTKQAVLRIVEDFANGADDVLGNADDRLSPDTHTLLQNLILDGTIERLVEKMYKTSVVQKILRFLFPCLYV